MGQTPIMSILLLMNSQRRPTHSRLPRLGVKTEPHMASQTEDMVVQLFVAFHKEVVALLVVEIEEEDNQQTAAQVAHSVQDVTTYLNN